MKNKVVKILAITVSIVILLIGVTATAAEFTDTEGHWAQEQIEKWADKGLVSGYPDGTFKPDDTITRAEFAKIVALAFDLTDEDTLDEYNDLDEDTWYYPYVAKTTKYIPKYRLPVQYPSMEPYLNNAGGGFLPDSAAVRMHVAEALVEIKMDMESIKIEMPDIVTIQEELLETFNDADYENLYVIHNGTPASNAVHMFEYTWLANKLGIMQGDENGYFNPYGYVTRAEIVTMVDRIIGE